MRWIALLALTIATACGPLAQGDPVMGLARSVLGGGGDGDGGDSPSGSIVNQITRELIEAEANDLLLASVISREATAVLVRGGNNDAKVTWLSPDGIGVTLENGVLVATRGLGPDLMGADVSAVHQSFGNSGNYLRKHSYLNGLDQIEIMEFTCSMTRDRAETITIYDVDYATSVFIEVCEGGGESFRNVFWRASNGVIWQARQWISADIGYFGYQRL